MKQKILFGIVVLTIIVSLFSVFAAEDLTNPTNVLTGQVLRPVVYPFSFNSDTLTYELDSKYTNNEAPYIREVVITPENPLDTQTVTCTPTTKDEGGVLTYTYQWYLAYDTETAYEYLYDDTTNTLDLSTTIATAGSVVKCIVTATDSYGAQSVPQEGHTVVRSSNSNVVEWLVPYGTHDIELTSIGGFNASFFENNTYYIRPNYVNDIIISYNCTGGECIEQTGTMYVLDNFQYKEADSSYLEGMTLQSASSQDEQLYTTSWTLQTGSKESAEDYEIIGFSRFPDVTNALLGSEESQSYMLKVGYLSICQDDYYVTCLEDSVPVAEITPYKEVPDSQMYCANVDNEHWNWTYSEFYLDGFENKTDVREICGNVDDKASIDNNCNAYKYFKRTADGELNLTEYTANDTETLFYIETDDHTVDRFDQQCFGSLEGTILDVTGGVVEDAQVDLVIISPIDNTYQFYATTQTDEDGEYLFSSIPAYPFTVVASKEGYGTNSATVDINFTENVEQNITIVSAGCQSDCTNLANPNVCASACNGFNGCSFYNETIAGFLNGVAKGQEVYIESINATVEACTGVPQEGSPYQVTSVATEGSEITCPTGSTLIIYEQTVLYNGQPVKVKIPVCKS